MSKQILAPNLEPLPLTPGQLVVVKMAGGQQLRVRDDEPAKDPLACHVVVTQRSDHLYVSYTDGAQAIFEDFYTACGKSTCQVTIETPDDARFTIEPSTALGAAVEDGRLVYADATSCMISQGYGAEPSDPLWPDFAQDLGQTIWATATNPWAWAGLAAGVWALHEWCVANGRCGTRQSDTSDSPPVDDTASAALSPAALSVERFHTTVLGARDLDAPSEGDGSGGSASPTASWDRWVLDTSEPANIVLDLTDPALAQHLGSPEAVDLTGQGDNTLKLNLDDVLASTMSAADAGVPGDDRHAHVLRVDGNAGDQVQLSALFDDGRDGGRWEAAAEALQWQGEAYQVYEISGNPSAQLWVHHAVEAVLI